MTLKYIVSNQTLIPMECPERIVVEQTQGFVYLDLLFDPEWDGLSIAILFENDAIPGIFEQAAWQGTPVLVPSAVLVPGQLRIGCVGTSVAGGSKQLTTQRMARGIPVSRCGGELSQDPAQVAALLEQVLAAIGPLNELETEDKSNLVAAINEVLSKIGTGSGDRLPDYTGAYTVQPQAYEAQTLKTKNKSLRKDVTVEEIPIYEASNEYGTTINIGG